MTTRRLPGAGAELNRDEPFTFCWNGAPVAGFSGDTVVSALLAGGHDVISRSMKYHRPRGVLTADYWDPNCMVQVGSEPNVRGAHRLAAPAMDVRAQNVWPSLRHDVKAANALVGRFLTAGFYYKTFMQPRALWPAYEHVLATFAPGGSVDLDAEPPRCDIRFAHPDVLVAGGGPAGMAAALAASRAGADVLLVDHGHRLGGHLRWGSGDDRARAAQLAAAVRAAGVEVLTDATVLGRYDGSWVGINQRTASGVWERLVKARAKCLVVAPGLIERPYVFAGNDHVGVMLSGAVRRLLNMYGVVPGERAVVFSANPDGAAAARDLRSAGVEVTVVDASTGVRLERVEGSRRRAQAAVLSDGRRLDADLIVTAIGWTAPTTLTNMAGDRPVYDEVSARFFPDRLPPDVLVAGGLAGDGSVDELVAHAHATGAMAARRGLTVRAQLRRATPRADPTVTSVPPDADEPVPLGRDPHPALFMAGSHGIVDYSEDVSSKDIVDAAAEGFDSVELVKRFTTSTMGPSQGKLETVNTVAVLAQELGTTIGRLGTTVWRPPYAPVSLGALAGRNDIPRRVSALQDWHDKHGAVPLHAGNWLRPDHYGDPAAEAANVRNAVGVIDVTPLGKLDLCGPDVADLLELVYVNRWRKLAVGAVRYGVMCTEDGIVMDDGVTARLADQRYLMTTTSSGAAAVWEWLERWLQQERPQWDVRVTPVTPAYTSINVAGPRSRELVAGLVDDIDVSPDGFPYMQVRTGTVAGVGDCVLLRIGFTGELSYELHVPAGFGLHVWEALLATGAALGIRPFGVEAQRILRLEKGHFIVGQDTDGLTRAASAGLGGLVKLDKADMVGRPELGWAAARTDLPMLVSILTDDPSVVPVEAAQIVEPGTNAIRGRITSSRMSPTLGRSVCLGQVDAALAHPGCALTIRLPGGAQVGARVHDQPAFVDPEGVRLRG
ncbi:MAG: (2Fe-2S)-binding protein [Nocardioidaceae bacterium]|nr:(2Fe-2S)-binding protein [Nocardioidaceae bacterium]